MAGAAHIKLCLPSCLVSGDALSLEDGNLVRTGDTSLHKTLLCTKRRRRFVKVGDQNLNQWEECRDQ